MSQIMSLITTKPVQMKMNVDVFDSLILGYYRVCHFTGVYCVVEGVQQETFISAGRVLWVNVLSDVGRRRCEDDRFEEFVMELLLDVGCVEALNDAEIYAYASKRAFYVFGWLATCTRAGSLRLRMLDHCYTITRKF